MVQGNFPVAVFIAGVLLVFHAKDACDFALAFVVILSKIANSLIIIHKKSPPALCNKEILTQNRLVVLEIQPNGWYNGVEINTNRRKL